MASRFTTVTVNERKYSVMLVSDGNAERVYGITTRVVRGPSVMREGFVQHRTVRLNGPTAQKIKSALVERGEYVN